MTTAKITSMKMGDALTESVVSNWSEEECREALMSCMELTAEAIRRAALIVKVMDDHGFDLSDMPQRYVTSLRRVACGQLLPQFLLECSTTVVNAISTLTRPTQEKLLRQKSVEVLTDKGEMLRVSLANLQSNQVKQAIRDGALQDAAGQRAYKESVMRSGAQTLETVCVDYNNQTVLVRRACELSLRQLKRLVRELSPKGEA